MNRRRILAIPMILALDPMQRAVAQQQATGDNQARLQEALADMGKKHEIVPFGIEIKDGWHVGPTTVMGTEPYAAAVPTWWRKGTRYAEWRSLAAWFTVYLDAAGSASGNTGVEIDGIEAWALVNSSNQWEQLRAMRQPAWQGAYNPNAVQALRKSGGKMLASGGFLAIPTRDYMVHGGISQTALPWTDRADFRALLVSVRHRLALIDPAGPDDRPQAGFGVMAGADYYPWVGAGLADLGADYNPGAGSGRFLRVTTAWRYSTVLLQSKRRTSNSDLGQADAVPANNTSRVAPPAFTY